MFRIDEKTANEIVTRYQKVAMVKYSGCYY